MENTQFEVAQHTNKNAKMVVNQQHKMAVPLVDNRMSVVQRQNFQFDWNQLFEGTVAK